MKNKETQNIKNNKKIEIFIFEFIRYALFKTEKKTEKSTKKKNNFFNLRKIPSNWLWAYCSNLHVPSWFLIVLDSCLPWWHQGVSDCF